MAKEIDYVYHNRISDMEINERPRERLVKVGPGSISNYELLAILLRTGTAGENVIDLSKRILNSYGGLGGLKKITFEELKNARGIGEAKATQVLAAVELGKRLAGLQEENDRLIINSSQDVFDLVSYEMSAFDHEELWVLNVDTRHRLVAIDRLYKGSLNSSTVRISEVFRKPITRNVAAILLVHNHPSGDPKPSAADIAVTKSVQEAGNLLEITMLDHIIIGSGKYESILSYLI